MVRMLGVVCVVCVNLCADRFINFQDPNPRPFGAPLYASAVLPPASPPQPATVRPQKGSELLARLSATYAQKPIEFENLRAVTLAMMLLESGRAQSDLAREHYNFGGLKYRPEMNGFASSVRYRASDGVDDYCKFDSIEDFLAGFWYFLDRSPYEGWRQYAHDPRRFIEFVGPIYCPFNPDYADHVMRLLPEAQALLEQHDPSYRVAELASRMMR